MIKRLAMAVTALMIGGATAAVAPSASAMPPPVNGFSSEGPWNTMLPPNPPIASNSAAVVANIKSDVQNYYGTFGINTTSYSAPIYTVGKNTPTQDWSFNDCQHKGYLDPKFAAALKSVPTPSNMVSSEGTDAEVAIYRPSTDTYWDFWVAHKDANGQWSACWGGKIDNYRLNPGIFDPPLGATATGLPLGAYLIRIKDLQRGWIDHAIGIETVHTQADCTSWPANRNDGNTAGPDYPCEGERFQLDPSFDVNTLQNPAARTIARAMQQYGLILTDSSGAVVTQAEDPRPYMAEHDGINPYDALFGGPSYSVIPPSLLDHLRALPINYGKP